MSEWERCRDAYVPVAKGYKSVARIAEIDQLMDDLRDERVALINGGAGALVKNGCPREHATQVIRCAVNCTRFPEFPG